MSARQGVVVLVNPEEEGEIVRAIDQTSGLKVVRRCADLAEARAAIRAKVAALVVLDMSDPDLDAITIDELHRFGAGVILVADPEDTAPARSLGADGLCARGFRQWWWTLYSPSYAAKTPKKECLRFLFLHLPRIQNHKATNSTFWNRLSSITKQGDSPKLRTGAGGRGM